MQGLCKEHLAVVTWVCVHKGKHELVCVYCVNRNHQGHTYQVIAKCARPWRSKLSTEAKEIRQIQMRMDVSVQQIQVAEFFLFWEVPLDCPRP